MCSLDDKAGKVEYEDSYSSHRERSNYSYSNGSREYSSRAPISRYQAY